MSKFLLWIILSALTGSPVLAAVALLLLWWTVDRFTARLLPDPIRALVRWRRVGKLRSTLATNPHDRRARLELAELLCGKGKYREALELLRPNLEAGDDDPSTLFVMGTACMGAGHLEQGEVFLQHVLEADPGFRMGEVELARGRWRLAKGDHARAREALERFCKAREGTVEGRVLLARALQAGGDDAAAALMREDAWREYVHSPRFKRRIERWWAWRAKPSRPLTYALALVLALGLFARFGAPRLVEAAEALGAHSGEYYPPYGAMVDEGHYDE